MLKDYDEGEAVYGLCNKPKKTMGFRFKVQGILGTRVCSTAFRSVGSMCPQCGPHNTEASTPTGTGSSPIHVGHGREAEMQKSVQLSPEP